jgi:hypothetical protein
VQGIGFINTPVEEGAKEEGVGCLVLIFMVTAKWK